MENIIWKQFFSSWNEEGGQYFIQSLIDAGLDINCYTYPENTLLSYAAAFGNLEIVEFLVRIGADIDARNSNGSTPLHIATHYFQKDIMEFFLKLGVIVDSRDNNNSTPLHYIAERTMLSELYKMRSIDIAQFLLFSGANLNARDRNGFTPVLLSASSGCIELVNLFIELGADVNCCDIHQVSLLHRASSKGWLDVVKYVAKRACDVNINNIWGESPIILAAHNSHANVVKFLLEFGADFTQMNLSKTVLHYASLNGWLDVVKCLVYKGCDVNVEDRYERTPLFYAVMYTHPDIVELLIESGARLEFRNRVGSTALHLACEKGFLDVVKSLIKMGSNIHAQTTRGDTPLHAACYHERFDVVEHLFKAGVDCNIRNVSNDTALDNLLEYHMPRIEIIKLFLENGAYFRSDRYAAKDEKYRYTTEHRKTLLQNGTLRDARLCTRAVINEFNNSFLPRIYKIPAVAKNLPPINHLKIVNSGDVAKGIEELVESDMQTKRYCEIFGVLDVLEVVSKNPMPLSMLCIRSFVKHCNSQQVKAGNSQDRMKTGIKRKLCSFTKEHV